MSDPKRNKRVRFDAYLEPAGVVWLTPALELVRGPKTVALVLRVVWFAVGLEVNLTYGETLPDEDQQRA